jgi:hypothetical protein
MNNIFAPKNLFFVIVIIYVTFPQISTAQHTKVISEILDNHGKIKSGVDGSFDASGYTLEYGDNNEPVLKKKTFISKKLNCSLVNTGNRNQQ